MSVAYWGDKFYGINRIKNPEIFDKEKERKIILDSLYSKWYEEEVNEYLEEDISFDNLDALEIDNGGNEVTDFLNGTGVYPYYCYCCNQDIMFFGIYHCLPWEIEKIETQEEVNKRIYNALKPILKDTVTFEQFQPLIKTIIINGQDDYISYYEID